MRYFSEETVMDILDKIERENGHAVASSFPNFSELKSINIPDKHGRLGDLDELERKVIEEADFPSYELSRAVYQMRNAPTIVEASNV